MADVGGLMVESKRGKGWMVYYPDASNFNPKTKAIFAQFGRCESCTGALSLETLRCLQHGHDDGIWISEEGALEQIELVLGDEKRRNKNLRRAERRNEAMVRLPGFHRRSDLRAILKAQGGQCYYCGATLEGVKSYRDHLEPLNSSRSSNWPSNIVLACYPCNRDKSDLSPRTYWRVIAQKRGPAWVKRQQVRNVVVAELAKELTKQRKQELARGAHRTTARRPTRRKKRAPEAGHSTAPASER
jgi:5-methylcytosine-specific restriction endonuclease McrA